MNHIKPNPSCYSDGDEIRNIFFEQIKKISISAWGERKWLDTQTK